MKAVQYEHHLAQEADQHRAELLCARLTNNNAIQVIPVPGLIFETPLLDRQDADGLQLDVALLREQLQEFKTDKDRERTIAPKQILTFSAAVQTEVDHTLLYHIHPRNTRTHLAPLNSPHSLYTLHTPQRSILRIRNRCSLRAGMTVNRVSFMTGCGSRRVSRR
jgi:hypothetical protein